MAAIAVNGRPDWLVSDLELQTPGRSYTANTLRQLQAEGYLPSELFFIIGADAFGDIESWHDYPALLSLANFVVVSRPHHPVGDLSTRLPRLAGRFTGGSGGTPAGADTSIFLIDAPTTDVSSTTIRQRIIAGLPVDDLVPADVLQHIDQHGLYRSPTLAGVRPIAPDSPAAGRLHGED
jgi:nicotinate-nucleotide adenylyltransferase